MKEQRTLIAQALLRLAPNVTAQDRTNCAKKLKISKVSICYYLNGKVTNNEKGLKMVEFFKNAIAEKAQKIETLCK